MRQRIKTRNSPKTYAGNGLAIYWQSKPRLYSSIPATVNNSNLIGSMLVGLLVLIKPMGNETMPNKFEYPSKDELNNWQANNMKAIKRLDFWIKCLEQSTLLIAFVVFVWVMRVMI